MLKSLKTWFEMTSAGAFLLGVFQAEIAALIFSLLTLGGCLLLAREIERRGL